ncbi:MAG: nodulation protein NfeD [Syntrophus sp. (in: bacteria)]|nr:nodulation protein NfeD [Syntrophus sp. (in: bacteria)]
MKYKTRYFLILWLILGWTGLMSAAERRPVYDVIRIDSAITPPVADYILQSIDGAAKSGSNGLVVLLDTPGGLDLAMRDIVKGLLGAPIPVIVYVSPSGARAASAGMIIMMAAHVSAMAPGTNIGAAHPVGIGIGGGTDKVMMEKVENDAVAYAISIARQKGRNEEWVERAVRKSESIPADQALQARVIDLVAKDLTELLEQLSGREVRVGGNVRVLETKGAMIREISMNLRQKVLTTLSDPNIAYILFLLGAAGLYFELAQPGAILPGVIGGISLIMSFFAMQTLPVNYAGIALILFALILFIAEIKIISHGLLSVGGVISLLLGSLLLFDSPEPALRVSFKVMIPTLGIVSAFFVFIVSLVVKAQMGKKHTGLDELIGAEGIAVTDIYHTGKTFIRGEYWDAWSEHPVAKGKQVRVERIAGMKMQVMEI